MVLRLDPRIPLVWRSPDTIQLGVERPVATLHGITAAHERIIAALQSGLPRSGVDYVASTAGASSSDVDALIALLAPALIDSSLRGSGTVAATVLIDGAGPTADRLRGMLDDSGAKTILAADDGVDPDAVVVIAHHVIVPERYGRWMRRDVPHLPITFGDAAVTIGPFVQPGAGPCLFCVELARADSDPAWAAIAAQLVYRSAGTETAVAAIAAAAAATALVTERMTTGRTTLAGASVVIDPRTSASERRTHQWHADCGCRALPGIGSARAAHVGTTPPATSSTAASAAPA